MVTNSAGYLDLYGYRKRVNALYRDRDQALKRGESAESVLERFRRTKDQLFRSHSQSPIPEQERRSFAGLDYYPYNPAACVAAAVDTAVEQHDLLIATSGEGELPMSRVATLHFAIEGHQAELSLYWIDVYGGGLFLCFRDASAPAETYGGGRYLMDTVKGADALWLPERGGVRQVMLDFNYAYNPSCAYDYRWACPLAPPENRLPFPLRAGEKKPATE